MIGATALLLAMGALGFAALRRASRGGWGLALTPLEQVAYGAPLGVVVATLAMLALAIAYGFGVGLVVLIGTVCAVGAVGLWASEWFDHAGEGAAASGVGRPNPWALLVLGALTLRWAFFWRGAFPEDAAGIWAASGPVWSDTTVHLADVSAFAYGDNFPPASTLLVGHAPAYHYLGDLNAAALVVAGVAPTSALALQGFVGSVLVTLALYAFARRLTRSGGAALLATLLWFFGGGLGWLLTLRQAQRSGDPLDTIWNRPWDGAALNEHNLRWLDTFFAFVAPQRAWLLGLPLALLVLTLLLIGVERGRRAPFVAAGIAAGVLPLAHLAGLLAMALIVPFLAVLSPWRAPRLGETGWLARLPMPRWLRLPASLDGWLVFGVLWVVLAVPQVLWVNGGEGGAADALRRQVGWVAAPDSWWWFWLKNLGLFLPLLVLALLDRRLFEAGPRRLLWACMPIFVVANLVVFQPWDWDNTKVLLYWFVAATILVAALVSKAWRAFAGQPHALAGRVIVAGLVATLLASGALAHVHQARGFDRALLYNQEEIGLAESIRRETPATSLIAVGAYPNNAVLALGGRQVMMAYPGWLWSHGFDAATVDRDLRAIYALGTETPALIAAYGVDYVVVGRWEQANFGVAPADWRARYPVAIETPNYLVFAVGT